MIFSQACIKAGRDRVVCRIQALTEQGEALGETQGLPSLQTEGGRREKDNGGGDCGEQQRWEKDLCWSFMDH